MYFLLVTVVQRLPKVISLQANFVAKDFEKEANSFIPQRPHAFGLTIFSQATQGVTWLFFNHAHKNLLHTLFIEERMLLGTQYKPTQYTGMAIATDFINTNLPALDNHLKL